MLYTSRHILSHEKEVKGQALEPDYWPQVRSHYFTAVRLWT